MDGGDPPRIDGKLDDALWQNAAKVTSFVQERPVESAPATEATEVFIAFDSQRIYFGIHAHYSNPALMRANRVDRDQISRDDIVTVFFDPFLDQQRGYAFSVNGYGVQGDSLLSGGGAGLAAGPAAAARAAAARVAAGRAAAVARVAAAAAVAVPGIPRGTPCSSRPVPSSRTAGPPSWRFRSRVSAIRRARPIRSIAGASRFSARSRARTRATSGRPCPATSWASSDRWVCSTA